MRRLIQSVSTAFLFAACSPNYLTISPPSSAPIVHKSETEALPDLRKLVREAKVEEAWVYLPEREEWHDIGLETTITDHSASLNLDLEKIEQLATDYSILHFYHIHPEPLDARVVPSADDIGSAIYFFCKYQHQRKKDFHYLLASSHGIMEYVLNGERFSDFCRFTKEEDFFERGKTLGRIVVNSRELWTNESRISSLAKKKVSTTIFNNGSVEIIFTPYPKFMDGLQ
ncbi:hypothetical protein HYT55_00730 [Candidatus Woesearchaeota archaeon]|nr:hypothetical protein [Candidatus Woesearchaeota archaeon]